MHQRSKFGWDNCHGLLSCGHGFMVLCFLLNNVWIMYICIYIYIYIYIIFTTCKYPCICCKYLPHMHMNPRKFFEQIRTKILCKMYKICMWWAKIHMPRVWLAWSASGESSFSCRFPVSFSDLVFHELTCQI